MVRADLFSRELVLKVFWVEIDYRILSILSYYFNNVKTIDVDIRNYAKYILNEGTILEKRELLSCLKSKLILENRKLRLER